MEKIKGILHNFLIIIIDKLTDTEVPDFGRAEAAELHELLQEISYLNNNKIKYEGDYIKLQKAYKRLINLAAEINIKKNIELHQS